MPEPINDLKLHLDIDGEIIYEFHEVINEESMVNSAKHIEELLKNNNVKPGKIQNVFELMIEIMQNILNYSYGNTNLENNKKEARGFFSLSYKSSNDAYTFVSCNLIQQNQKELIENKLNEIKNLDNEELRKLSRERMKTKEHIHNKGAGLGFIMMARKSIEPIAISFAPHKKGILEYTLKLVA